MADHPLIEVKLRERQADRLVLGVTGEIDHASVGAFLDKVETLLGDGHRHLVVDLSGCAFCDSAGISAMVGLMRQTQDLGGQLVLAGPRGNVARTLDLTGLNALMPSYPTVADALAALPARHT